LHYRDIIDVHHSTAAVDDCLAKGVGELKGAGHEGTGTGGTFYVQMYCWVAFHDADEAIFYSESVIEDKAVRAGVDLVGGIVIMGDVHAIVAGIGGYEVITDVYTIENGGWRGNSVCFWGLSPCISVGAFIGVCGADTFENTAVPEASK
jgi:hypothetical protein